ncbi:DNA ligase 3 [Podosphaera aphanis]|nr:DNA ligase 3 [Podosphaera aphanis]
MAGKKRKRNEDHPKVSRGLDYFFAKRQQTQPVSNIPTLSSGDKNRNFEPELTDEQIARKLQAEWNKEEAEIRDCTIAKISKSIPSDFGSLDISNSLPNNKGPQELENPVELEDNSTTKPSANLQGTKSSHTLSLQKAGLDNTQITSDLPLDQSPLTFDPSKHKGEFHNSLVAGGGETLYALLIRCFVLVSNTSSRIKIVDTLVNFLRLLIEEDPKSLLPAVWLTTNAISPPFISLELGLGGSAISKALKNVYGLDAKSLKSLHDKVGDAGDVAFEMKKRQKFTLRKPKPLTIIGVYQTLVKIATTQGVGSGEVKQRLIDRLLQDSQGAEESRFMVRTLCQHLRIGAVKTTMLIALSRAFQISRPPNADFPLKSVQQLSTLNKETLTEVWAKGEEIVKACFARRPNYNDLVPALLKVGVSDELLVECGLTLHIPLRPMLGSITRDLLEVFTKLQARSFCCEYKYDGQRAQVHCDEKGNVSIFSRHLELMTDKYPDLVALMPKIRSKAVTSFIMEGEVVAIDQSSGELKPFQTLSNRARKSVAIGNIKVDVCLFAFDLMYLNGESLLQKQLRERRNLLRELFTEIPNHFTWVKSIDATSQDADTVLEFFKSAIDSKCEGIMVKVLDNSSTFLDSDNIEAINTSEVCVSPKRIKINGKDSEKKPRCKPLLATYEPDKRLECWLKVKKDYSTTFDTLDLIPIAAWHGQGRKSKWWSPILLAVRNEDIGSLQAVCKCISGFTDTFYKENKEFYSEEGSNVLSRRPSYIEYRGPEPDVWFEPQEVFEMAFADLTLSPVYTAAIGLVSDVRGLSMRFPRFVKKRADKSLDEASTHEFLAALWRKQEAKSMVDEKALRVEDAEEDEAE